MMVSWQQSIQAGKLPLNNAHCDFGILWLHLGYVGIIWAFGSFDIQHHSTMQSDYV